VNETKEDKALAAARAEREKRSAAHVAAQAATKLAQDVFDVHGDGSAEKSLNAARTAEQSAAEHLGRASRLVDKAEGEAATARKARLEGELAIAEREYNSTSQDAKLVEAEFRAFVALVDSMMAREILGAERRVLVLRMIGLRSALGIGTEDLTSDIRHSVHRRSFHQVRNMLMDAATSATDDFRRMYFQRLALAELDLGAIR